MKLYQDATTKELVFLNGEEVRYPAFSEIQRISKADTYLTLKTVSGIMLITETIYSDFEDLAGTPYVSFAALKTALDGYFDSTI
jgi:hypothetical protein